MSLRWALPLAFASGGLYFLAFPGVGWWPLGYVALAPMLVAIRRRRVAAGALLGLAGGTLTTFLGFFWLVDTIHIHGHFPWVVALLLHLILSVVQAGRFALFGALVCAIDGRRWPWLVAVSGAFVASEVAYPLLFPWFLGACLHAHPALLQTADVGGPVLVGLPMAITSALVATLFSPRGLRVPERSAVLAAAAAILLPLIYGVLVLPFVDRAAAKAPRARIGLVQGNIPMPPATGEALHARFLSQIRSTQELTARGAELVFWPESSFVHVLSAEDPGGLLRRTEASSLDVPLLVGALVETAEESPRLYNSALMVDRHGKVQGRYDKQHLLPFGEYLPLGDRFPWLYRLSPGSGRISPGPHRGPVPFEDKRITVLVCYEDILPGFVNTAARHQQPHLLANLTNDGWFGESEAAGIHLALAKFRAVEHRRYLVRATNTGMTAVVDPVGRVVVQAPAWVEASLVGEVRWLHGWTLYGWWGDLPWYLVVMGALGCAWVPCPWWGRKNRT